MIPQIIEKDHRVDHWGESIFSALGVSQTILESLHELVMQNIGDLDQKVEIENMKMKVKDSYKIFWITAISLYLARKI